MTKVLLVEDDNNLREIYEARLAAEGYEISTAKDGEDALAVAKQVKPDLIISDVMMPRISGFEMLDILRNTDGLKHTKIIMLTALGQAEDKTRADSLGADRYLVKSQVTLEDIVKAADELLNPDATATAEQSSEAVPAPEVTPTNNLSPIAPPGVAAAAHQPEAVQPAPAMPTVSASEPNDNPEAAVTPIPDATAQPASAPDPVAPPTPAEPATPVSPPVEPVAAPVQPAPAPVDNTTQTDTEEPLIQMPPQPTNAEAATATATQAQSTTQENEAVAQQIENFVNTAPSQTPVAPAPPAESVAPAEPAAAAAIPEQSANDEVIKSAIDNLAVPTEAAPEEPVAPAPAPGASDDTNSDESSVAQISGKKVISPINDINAKDNDLQTLLAQEQMKEDLEKGVTGTPVIGDTSTPAASVPETQPAPAPAPSPDTNASPATPPPGGVFVPNENGNANENAL